MVIARCSYPEHGNEVKRFLRKQCWLKSSGMTTRDAGFVIDPLWMLRCLMAFFVCCCLIYGCGDSENGSPATNEQTPESFCSVWKDHPANPLIEPLPGWQWPNSILADPTVVVPEESPDGTWHLFAHSLQGIHHYISIDGITWEKVQGEGPLFEGMRPSIYREGSQYFMLYERVLCILPLSSVIEIRSSPDLFQWGIGVKILEPTLPWERSIQSNTTGNPFLIKRDRTYWLYYSANGVFLPDCFYFEPKFIGVARAEDILGPYQKEPEPLIRPSSEEPFRNMGAGSMKLLSSQLNGLWIGFNNGIYQDLEGNSRSAILVLSSHDGLTWDLLCPEPVIKPGDQSWKTAFVYAFDVKKIDHEYWMYYNARNGWLIGTERIGLCILSPEQ